MTQPPWSIPWLQPIDPWLSQPLPSMVSTMKRAVGDLACFGGAALLPSIRSASNLVQPDWDRFAPHLHQAQEAGSWVGGAIAQELERRLAEFHEVEHCITFCNGLWAIVVALDTLKLGAPSHCEVVLPSLTYRRLADIAAWVGLTPRFCDVDSVTLAATPEHIEPCINPSTAALLIAHPIVNVCDVEAIQQLARKHGLPLLFDSVEAAHASVGGKVLGGFGDAECYSMHASKFLNGFEGGYVTTNNPRLARALRRRRDGASKRRGGRRNSKASTPFPGPLHEAHAALALASLDDYKGQVRRNRRRFDAYVATLHDVPGMRLVPYDVSERRTFKNTLVELTPEWPLCREHTIQLMHAENLLVRPYYSPPLHLKSAGYSVLFDALPNTERLAEKYLLLPSGEFLQCDEVHRIGQLLQFVQQHGKLIQRRWPNRVERASSRSDQRSESELVLAPGRQADSERAKWEQTARGFQGIYARKYYTNHGPLVKLLEEQIAAVSGARHALAMTNVVIATIIVMRAWQRKGAWYGAPDDIASFQTAAQWAGCETVDMPASKELLASSIPGTEIAAIAVDGTREMSTHPQRVMDCISLAKKLGAGQSPASSPPIVCLLNGRPVLRGHVTIGWLGAEPTGDAYVLTNDDALAARFRNMRSSYGAGAPAEVPLTGNGRMSEAQAWLALIDLEQGKR